MIRPAGSAAALALTIVGAPAHAVDLADPAPLAAAFRETCLEQFPRIGAIAGRAAATGWVERKVSITSGQLPPGMSTANLPRFFEWRGLSLILVEAGEGMTSSCQVSTTGARQVTLDALATALRPDTPVRERRGGEDSAVWRQDNAEVRASIGGRVRNLIYIIRTLPGQARS